MKEIKLTKYEKENYLLKDKRDLIILLKIKNLEKRRLNKADKEIINLIQRILMIKSFVQNSLSSQFCLNVEQSTELTIRTQLKKDWRSSLIDYVENLENHALQSVVILEHPKNERLHRFFDLHLHL